MSLGERLREERLRHKWTQEFVAEKLGITNTVLSNYELNYRDPDTETLTKLVELYDVSADYILGRQAAASNCGQQYNVTKEEYLILEELKKYPDLFYALVSNPEKNVKHLIHIQNLKKMLVEDNVGKDNENDKLNK